MVNCFMMQTENIQAIVGDASRNGSGGTQYCGLWSLTSKDRVFNVFGNSYAGLIPGEIRGRTPKLNITGRNSCALVMEASEIFPKKVCAEYHVKDPYYIDHRLSLIDKKDNRLPDCGFREVTWCSYINSPYDNRISFLSNGNWHKYMSPEHGTKSNVAPAYLKEKLEEWPIKGPYSQNGKRSFHWERYENKFDEPFYYGRLDHMVLIKIFDNPEWLRFYMSPTGGGQSLIKGKSCPAWDFEWVIPEYEYYINKEYIFKMRLVYKPFISNEDILNEFWKAKKELAN